MSHAFFGGGFFGGGFFSTENFGGNSSGKRKKQIKRKWKTLRRSEFDTETDYRQAMQAVIAPPVQFDETEDENEALLAAIGSLTMRH